MVFGLLASLLIATTSGSPLLQMPNTSLKKVVDTLPVSVRQSYNIEVDIDTLGKESLIEEGLEGFSDSQDEFVKRLVDRTYYSAYGSGLNAVVVKASHDYDASGLSGIKFFGKVRYFDDYRVWLFEDGVFKNEGDGGYINWAFIGAAEQSGTDGKTVTFSYNGGFDV